MHAKVYLSSNCWLDKDRVLHNAATLYHELWFRAAVGGHHIVPNYPVWILVNEILMSNKGNIIE